MTDKTRYRITVISDGTRKIVAQKNVLVSDPDELRGEIENFCMELERSYPCPVRCESAEQIEQTADNGKERSIE